MESLTGEDVLETLPFGVLRVEDDRISYASRMLRSLFDGALSTLPKLIEAYPELDDLHKLDGAGKSPVWLNVNATIFCVTSQRREIFTEYYFLPSWFVSGTDTGLEALQNHYDDFVEIFENCFDGIYVADGAGRTLWLNAGFERCYGLSARNFLGRNASKLEREGYVEPLITWKIISTKKRQTALQTTKSGRKVLATGIPLFAQDGSVRRVIINSRDTTELIEMQDKLNAAEREIQNYERELRQIRERAAQDGELIWSSDTMQEVVRLAMRIAGTDAATLITGPTGAGKRKLADLVFRYSKRSKKRVLRVGFGNLPESALDAELFGRADSPPGRRDDGLLARASGGTLVLERIDLMPPLIQEKLSSWIRNEETRRRHKGPDLRLISTSRTDLGVLVTQGKFREDLFFRLGIAQIDIPPLNGRVADIASLAKHFLDAFNTRYGAQKTFERAAINRLSRWPWHGNVRELRAIVERLVVTETSTRLNASHVDSALNSSVTLNAGPGQMPKGASAENIRQQVQSYEAALLKEAVAKAGSIQKASVATGISVSTIKRKLAWLRRQANAA
ncbi:sigma 54-interacting transcriptional regulator [Roseovarius sp. CAU 1744]|uniref:sigma 54-interacting transcriptional regulator n=1 Tax=Roseovarius sp. CAU 1744 TaxID=3140368 RepID=UPI00325B7A98